jgi:hypothetical protein
MVLSLALLVAVYIRPVRSTDYLQQARDAVPSLLWGFGSSLTGAVLCNFGKSAMRVAFVIASIVLLFVWLMLAGSAA